MSAPDITIVVAAVDTAATLAPWLDAVRPQLARHDVEVLLAAAADEGAGLGAGCLLYTSPSPRD